MDSMRSLNTSLPRSPRKTRSTQPPEQLIQAFKTAALSVTNLYKTAATDQENARESGYQEALDDLLTFLDRENIGLDDGEGWRIRRWATERLDGSPTIFTTNDSDEDTGDQSKGARSQSPVAIKPTTQDRQPSASPSPINNDDSMPPTAAPPQNTDGTRSNEMFTFRSAVPYPPDTDMQPIEIPNNAQSPSSPDPQIPAVSVPAVRVEVVPRALRTPQKSGNTSNRVGGKSANQARISGHGAGTKRRFTLGDYFDISNLGDLRDAQGGGKRSRFS